MDEASDQSQRNITPRRGQYFRDRRESLEFEDGGEKLYVHICTPDVDPDDPKLIKEIFRVYRLEKAKGKGPVEPAIENAAEGCIPQVILSRAEAGNLMLNYYLVMELNEHNIALNYDKVHAGRTRPPGRAK